MFLQLKGLKKIYEDEKGLKNLDLEIEEGSFVTLLGPSGCGKTTTLNLLGGFIQPDSGHILLEGEDITGLPPERRPVSTVFQSYALFPHLNVLDNVCYGLRFFRGMKKKEAAPIAMEELKTVGLSDMKRPGSESCPAGSSRGWALARAMATGPKILLLDEPLSNLDAGLRVQLREELKELQKKLGITMVFVTHDQEEALSLSDKIVVMEKGVAVQTGTPREIYFSPVSRYVAVLCGKGQLYSGEWPGTDRKARGRVDGNGPVRRLYGLVGQLHGKPIHFMNWKGSNVIKADLFGREGSLFSVGDRVRAGWGSRKDGPRDCHL